MIYTQKFASFYSFKFFFFSFWLKKIEDNPTLTFGDLQWLSLTNTIIFFCPIYCHIAIDLYVCYCLVVRNSCMCHYGLSFIMIVDYLLLQLEEHEKALKILVHKLKDYTAAETYCLVNAKDGAYKRKLFHILLSVYLDPSYEWVPKISILETKKSKKTDLKTHFEDSDHLRLCYQNFWHYFH